MVEGARLESVYGSNTIASSNPVLSARIKNDVHKSIIFYKRSAILSTLLIQIPTQISVDQIQVFFPFYLHRIQLY